MQCSGEERTFQSCYREYADDKETHASDMVVECSNTDYSAPVDIKAQTVRLVDRHGNPVA